ncbi:HD domain-containing protein [Rodentibacter ratti]|uniref:Guanosine-3',5'-bis(Diphosphate) 3'-pyrophosphohydrolase n=1 Tax=Rodentibacter ratti TaxID=1906745 RepID=A0A1V3L814_9PAST|nr:HD domain-containing protein [Rodentibacter ratti]OOF85720.1 guanosine-3',5'-bis(diphosphate) 3'-pyrophosphohydrolase [Rodentibacter ratti]
MTDLIQQAKTLAFRLHINQTDKAGKPYIQHLQAVVDNLIDPTEEMIAVAWLHDSVEDTEIGLKQIKNLFGDTILLAVDAITKRKNEPYSEYLNRVKANPIARLVKIADLTHNMDLSRLPTITSKDLERLAKYQLAKNFLSK